MISHIVGAESTALVAPSESLYYETIEFYASFGFVEIKSYAKSDSTVADPVFCQDSEKEAWLIGFDAESDETATLKIRLVPQQHSPPSIGSLTPDRDWRGQTVLLTFRCRSIQVSVFMEIEDMH